MNLFSSSPLKNTNYYIRLVSEGFILSIQQLYESGEDAFSNLWEATISTEDKFDPNMGLINALKFRVESLTFPEVSIPTYTVHYNNFSIDRIGSKVENPKEFTFNLRIDKNWEVYKRLLNWHEKIISLKEFKLGKDNKDENFRGSVLFNPYYNVIKMEDDRKKQITKTIPFNVAFYKVFPKSIPSIDFTYSSSEPIVLAVVMGFVDFEIEYNLD